MTNLNPFLESAPVALVNLHSKVNRGKDILWRLLTDPKMNRTWIEIGKRCSGARDYASLWNEIVYALKISRIPNESRGEKRCISDLSRAEKRDHFLGIAHDSEKLAGTITDGPLDRLTYEFFPDDEAKLAFQVGNWSDLGPIEREEACRGIPFWPSMTGLLEELARRSRRLAEEALTDKRTVERVTQDRRVNYFVRHLANYFGKHFKGSMDGSLANIASVVFEKPIDKKFVKQTLRH